MKGRDGLELPLRFPLIFKDKNELSEYKTNLSRIFF